VAQARHKRDDYPVGIPLRPPPGWKGRGVTALPPPLPSPLLAPPVAPESARLLAVKAGLVAAMVFVCASVGWLAVADSRGPRAKPPRSKVAPEPVAKQTPREEPKADFGAKPVAPEPPPPPVPVLTYERHILPIMERSCLMCHGRKKKRGELDLSTFAALVKGGEGGTAVTPGKPAESLLLETILAGKMPPGGKKLPERDVRLIREWIQTGARGGR
jgi:Planctomycete cytochrome C